MLPRRIGIELTTICQLSCAHCNLVSYRKQSDWKAGHIDPALVSHIGKIIAGLAVKINLAGGFGEALSNPMLPYYVKDFSNSGHRCILYSSPQALFTYAERLTHCIENGLYRIYISIDEHHANQNVPKKSQNPDYLKNVQEALKKAQSRTGLDVVGSVVISDHDSESVSQAVKDVIAALRPKKISLRWQMPIGSYSRLAIAHMAAIKVIRSIDPCIDISAIQRPAPIGECAQSKKAIYFNVDGQIRICCADRDFVIKSNVRDYSSMAQLIRSRQYHEGLAAVVAATKSGDCHGCPNLVEYR